MTLQLIPGALLLFHGKPAKLEGVNKEKIEIRTAEGDSKSVRPKDVEFLHPGPVSSLNLTLPPEPEWNEVLELMEGSALPFPEFAELAYGGFTPETALAGWKVLQEGTYFTGTPAEGVTPRSKEEIEGALNKLREKEEEKLRREALIARIKAGTIEEEDKKNLREIEAVGRGESVSSKLMKDLGMEASPEVAHKLLLKLKVWDPLYDPWPSRLELTVAPPESPLPEMPEEPREDHTSKVSYAIDDEGSNDPDDAIAFEDGILYVHVADPASAIAPGTPADEEACKQGESGYLPEILTPMLPEGTVERFGLGLAETSPALTFAVKIDDEGTAHLEKMAISTVHTVRHTYESASELAGTPEFCAMNEALERFKERRRREGAVFIQLPEVKTRLKDGVITITPCPITPEREMVANAMLAAGAAVASYMAKEMIPFPFATQAPPDIDPAQCGDTLPEMFELRRNCNAGVVGVIPGKHSGLGLEPYARVTSPLRRYADLLAHQQIRKLLHGETLMDSEELEKKLTWSEEAGMRRRKLEKYVNEFYLMNYLALHPEWKGSGVIVDKQGDRLTILIPEFAYEYKCRLNGKGRVGDEVNLSFTAADPAALRLHLHIE